MKKEKFLRQLFFIFFIFLIFSVISLPPLFSLTIDEKRQEDETREQLNPTEKVDFLKDVIDFKWGGWFSSTYIQYLNSSYSDKIKEDVSHAWYQNVRAWGKITYKKIWSAYLRLKDTYVARKATASYTGVGSDNKGPTVDTGYVKLNVAAKTKAPFVVTIGRQYLNLGTGLAYSNTHDGLSVNGYFKKLFYKAFVSHTIPNEDNIDQSVPNYKKNGKRLFYGAEVATTRVLRHVVYGYFMFQNDQSGGYVANYGTDRFGVMQNQDFRYDSQYYGFGVIGQPLDELRYWAEYIFEKGKSYLDNRFWGHADQERRKIDASAIDAGVRWEPKVKLSPGVEFEYSFGSGDDDRTSVTDTWYGGNRYFSDNNFLSFGSYYAGYCLSPTLSNLMVYKIDISCKPFERLFKFGKKITLGAKYFKYYKDKANGGIYDVYADNYNYKDVGDEINAYAYFEITRKLDFVAKLGLFYPGKAYTNRDKYTYIYGKVTYRF